MEQIGKELINIGLLQSDLEAEIVQMLKNTSKSDMIQEILMAMEPKETELSIAKKMYQSQQVKTYFTPELQYILIRYQICAALHLSADNEDLSKKINLKIRKNKSVEKLLEQLVEQLKPQLSGTIPTIQKQLRSIEHIFKEIGYQKDQESIKALYEIQKKTEQEYLNQLKSEIKQMPENIPDYQIRIIEINFNERYLKQGESRLTLEEKDKIAAMEIEDAEGDKARRRILDDEDVQRNLKILREKICGMDIYETMRMIEKGRELKRMNLEERKIKKVKIILFFGLSKAGKTTLITRLLGHSLEKIKINGIYSLQPIDINAVAKKHKQLLIGYSNRSTTRYPKLYEIPKECLSESMKKDTNSIYYLMDSAGLEDSAGSEVEASNRISMIEFLKEVDSVSIAVVINKLNWGTRGQDIESLARTTSSIFRNLHNVRDSITFIFNNFDKEFKQTFQANVKDLYKNIQERGRGILDDNFKTFFNELEYQADPSSILTVDPLSLQPKQLIGKIWKEKDCIKDPSSCFIIDIGVKPKEKIRNLCERAKKLFRKYYLEGSTEKALYYIRLLQKIGSEPKFDSQAQEDIIAMIGELEKGLLKKFQILKVKFEEIPMSVIRDEEKFDLLAEEYKFLRMEIEKFTKLALNEKLLKQLKQLLSESLRWFKANMRKWQQYPIEVEPLTNETIIALAFYKRFANYQQLASFSRYLESLEIELNQKILERVGGEEKSKAISETLTYLYAMQRAQGKIHDCDNIQTMLAKKYYEAKSNAIAISFLKGDTQNYPQNYELTSTNRFFTLIQVLMTYPKDLTRPFIQEASSIFNQIVKQLPEQTFREYMKENEMENPDEMIQEKFSITRSGKQENIQKIDERAHLIKRMLALRSMDIIDRYHQGKINKFFDSIENIFAKQLKSQEHILESFQKGDFLRIKTSLTKLKPQYIKLQKTAETLSQSIKTASLFDKFKTQLQFSFSNFMENFNCVQNVSLEHEDILIKLIDDHKLLTDIFEVARNIKGINLNQKIRAQIKKIEIKIIDPINDLKKQIEGKSFQPWKIEYLRKYLKLIYEGDTLKDNESIRQKSQQIMLTIDKFFKKKVEDPLCELKKVIEIENGLNVDTETYLKHIQQIQNPQKFQKALVYLHETILFPELAEIYFPKAIQLNTTLFSAMELFIQKNMIYIMNDEIKEEKIIKIIKVFEKLKEIETKRELFEQVYQKYQKRLKFVRLDISNFQREEKQRRIVLQSSNFDADLFKKVCLKQFESLAHKDKLSKSQISRRNSNIQELASKLNKYQSQTKHKLSKIIKNSENQPVEKKLLDFTLIYSKYLQNMKPILQQKYFSAFTCFQSTSKIDLGVIELEDTFEEILQQDFVNMKEAQIQKKMKSMNAVENQIEKLEGYEFEQLKYFGHKISKIMDAVTSKLEQRRKKASKLKETQNFTEIIKVDKDFARFCYSLPENQKNQIYKNIDYWFKSELKEMEKFVNQNFEEYENRKLEMQENTKKLPIDLQTRIKYELEKIFYELEAEEELKFEGCSNSNFQELLDYGLMYFQKKNYGKIEKLSGLISLKSIQIYQDDLIFSYTSQFQKLKKRMISQHEIIKSTLREIESNLLQKITQIVKADCRIMINHYNQDVASEAAVVHYGMNQGEHKKQISENFEALLRTNTIFEENQEKKQEITQKITEFMNALCQSGSFLLSQFKLIIKDQMENTKVEDIFEKSIKFQEDVSMLMRSPELSKFASRLNNLLVNIQIYKKELKNILEDFHYQEFEINTNEEIEFDELYEEEKATIFETNMKALKNLANVYQKYLSPGYQINIDKMIERIQIKKMRARQQFCAILQQSLNEDFDKPLDKRILYIPRILALIASKPRQFLLNFSVQLQQCQNQLEKVQELRIKVLQKSREQLQKNSSNKLQIRNSSVYQVADRQQNRKSSFERGIDKSRVSVERKSFMSRQEEFLMEEEAEDIKEIDVEEKYENNLQYFIRAILALKKMASIPSISDSINRIISEQLIKISKTQKTLFDIHEKMQQIDNPYIGRIIDEFFVFHQLKGLKYQKETEKTNFFNGILDEMLKNKKINIDQKGAFESLHQKFEEEQKNYLSRYQETGQYEEIVNTLIKNIKADGENFALIHAGKSKTKKISSSQRVSLIAKIFSLWSIITSYSQNSDSQSKITICYKPHAAQILCVLILIGTDDNLGDSLVKYNRLSQVKTGEGKSIILAVLAIYFALFGYEVHCACYSQILSKRDESQFRKLISLCGVQKKIQYGIFEEIIKKVLNGENEQGTDKQFSEMVKDIVLEESGLLDSIKRYMSKGWKSFKSLFGEKKNNKILLIDEIDVLFHPRYFGDTYVPEIELKGTQICRLLEFIWNQRMNSNLTFESILKSKYFSQVCDKFKSLEKVLKNQIYGMLDALKVYKNQEYFIADKMIKYKAKQTLGNVHYQYITAYAYIEEFHKNKVSQRAYQQNLKICLGVAEFSYAYLPLAYHNMLGVSGTLEKLPQYIKQHLQTMYKIHQKQMYCIPSIYGFNDNREIRSPICCQKNEHFPEIIKSINQQFEKCRPILLFFRNKTQLLQFYNSENFKDYKRFASYISEDLSLFDQQERIKNSSVKNSITLMTSSFIRGIDFKLFNESVVKAGGFHGIVTYLIQSLADYIQATGRIARQGKPGSFVEIFCKEDLQLIFLTEKTFSAAHNTSQNIEIRRNQIQEKQKFSCQQKLNLSKKSQQKTEAAYQSSEIDQDKLISFILEKNKFPEIEEYRSPSTKILLLVQGTLAMEYLFVQLKAILPNVFKASYDKKKLSNLQMQIVVYRSYNSDPDKILEFSPFDCKGDIIKKYIDNTVVNTGWRNEAIEVALQYANSIREVDQIILFGNMRGNSKEEILQKQNRPDIQNHHFMDGLIPTSVEEEKAKLIKKAIKVYSFYCKQQRENREYFSTLSSETGGDSQYFQLRGIDTMNRIQSFLNERVKFLMNRKGIKKDEGLLSKIRNLF